MHEPILYLASASPRRHEILSQLDIAHYVLQLPSPDGEDEPQLVGEAPGDYVIRTACEKAARAAQWINGSEESDISGYITHSYPAGGSQAGINRVLTAQSRDVYILSADTTVILNDQVLGKPATPADAARMLTALSGTTHHVHTAIALYHDGWLSQAVSISEVRFKPLSDAEIQAYCRSGEPMGKAGSYGIQGRAAAFVSHLSGSYSGVMGLPAYETSALLAERGFFDS